ncbi:MAG: dipeptide/oligopeptide/nickel ABC transporter ATP-binding protein [Chloroflexi bacterium RBG_13_56_8]|nr:MAG: dipeptide/oligopeptide/nickel ABC transporter ATP-binding protein [Chloroflexi bacterium RBG_13_56_8]
MDKQDLLLEVKDLKTYFFLEEGTVRAVDGASFHLMRGETLGIVGESGCGKSVTAQSILRIVPDPGKITEGEIIYHRRREDNGRFSLTENVVLTDLAPHGPEIRAIRGAEIAMVFQEPMTSLSPVHTMGQQIEESFIIHQGMNKAEAREQSLDILARVGMPKPEQTIDSYPHQLSGGMRQRGVIAMALSCNPSLLIADEPTTALDVTTQAQILDLMRHLQDEMGMAIMFITHDLGVIAEMADRVVVMYLGKVVESADVDSIFHNPKHPYLKALLNSIPKVGIKSDRRLTPIEGSLPDPYSTHEGCPFRLRCAEFDPVRCHDEDPKWIAVGPEHHVRCHQYD